MAVGDDHNEKTGGVEPYVDVGHSSAHDVGEKGVTDSAEIIEPPAHVELTEDQAARRLRLFREAAHNDPNIEVDDLDAVDYAVQRHNTSKENQLVDELVENSPYPEVSDQIDLVGKK